MFCQGPGAHDDVQFPGNHFGQRCVRLKELHRSNHRRRVEGHAVGEADALTELQFPGERAGVVPGSGEPGLHLSPGIDAGQAVKGRADGVEIGQAGIAVGIALGDRDALHPDPQCGLRRPIRRHDKAQQQKAPEESQ